MQPLDGQTPETGELIVSQPAAPDLAAIPLEVELATMRQMMETVLARMETMQQNHAIQFSDVHERLDAVELEIPLIQEQSALRIRDLETRMSGEIEQAARSAAEHLAAGLQEDVAGKFGSLAARIETQQGELDAMREAKKLAESRLDRAILNIERLCADLGPKAVEVHRPAEAVNSPFRSKLSEHIRRAAVDAAPDGSNPLVGDGTARGTARMSAGDGNPEYKIPAPADSTAAPLVSAIARPPVEKPSPAFEEWKRQFMQAGEPLHPGLMSEAGGKGEPVICPRCLSERTRPATPARWDVLTRMAGFIPHRCRSCAYRFYKRGMPAEIPPDRHEASRTEEALESQ